MTQSDIISEYEILMASDHPEKAIELLDRAIERAGDLPATEQSRLYYLRGKARWRLDSRGAAISDYEQAASLDPASEAVQALAMTREIMDFFNPDMFNP